MRLLMVEDRGIEESVVEVTYNQYDRKVQRIVEIVEDASELRGVYRGKTHFIDPDDIYYIESVDNFTFIYTKEIVFESSQKLYEVEEALGKTSLIRISKNTILNMNYLKSVAPIVNYRLEATLLSGEKLVINRHYMQNVKEYLNI